MNKSQDFSKESLGLKTTLTLKWNVQLSDHVNFSALLSNIQDKIYKSYKNIK